MEVIHILGILAFVAFLTSSLSLPINNDSPKSAKRRIIIYYNTDQPPAPVTRSSAIAPLVPNLPQNINGTFRPSIPSNPLPPSLFTAQNLQQSFQTIPIATNQNFAIPSDLGYVPPTNVPPPSLVTNAPAKAVTAPLKGGQFSVEMLPPLFVPASQSFLGGWEIATSTVSPFAVFIPRALEAIKR